MKKPLALIILDGFGERDEADGNAVLNAPTPNLDRYRSQYPVTLIGTSGLHVGLPDGQMGNSEVGHLNIGAGRVVYQSFTKIDKSISDGDFFTNDALLGAIAQAKEKSGRLHIIGLLSDGGVHSHINHFYALLKMAKDNGLSKVFIHAVLDGRDVPPASAEIYLAEMIKTTESMAIGQIASIAGRYYTMDRDNRWDRVEKSYRAYVSGDAHRANDPIEALKQAYDRGETDEFVLPTVITDNDSPVGLIETGDSVIFANFRPDRAREITRTLTDNTFDGFVRESFPEVHFVCMCQYDETFPLPVAYPPDKLTNILGETLEKHGLTQLRIAETEKYAHVTFFFNGQEETPYPHEDRKLIPSPQVPTYDLKPEMSAYEVENHLLDLLKEDKYDVIVLNLANPDMVGHTGVYEAALQAVETVDICLGHIVDTIIKLGGTALITADHGNIEHMYDKDKMPITAHTTNPVPFILASENSYNLRDNGVLADIAPTILELLNIEKPVEMTGKSLIKH